MSMLQDITLFIPTHNRPGYLARILKYYSGISIKILVADSSSTRFEGEGLSDQVTYIHLPGDSLPKKMAKTLKMVNTKFVVMCADDDFIIPEGIEACLDYLKSNKGFIAAHGNCISYHKHFPDSESIVFSVMYTSQLSYQISLEDPFERAGQLFNPYRTIFCAVHYTKNLQLAYQETIPVNNLFLNEYLSGVIPIVTGKYIELPVFYQVREYAEDSGDKTTDNLDIITSDTRYREEYQLWLRYISRIVSGITGLSEEDSFNKIDQLFNNFSKSLQKDKEQKPGISFKKKIGNIIGNIPLIGVKIISKNRELERKAALALLIKNEMDKKNLAAVEKIIKTYANSTG